MFVVVWKRLKVTDIVHGEFNYGGRRVFLGCVPKIASLSRVPGVARGKLSDQVLIGNARWFIIFRWAVIALLIGFQIFALIASDTLTTIGITHQQGWPVAVTAILSIANIFYIYALDFRPENKIQLPIHQHLGANNSRSSLPVGCRAFCRQHRHPRSVLLCTAHRPVLYFFLDCREPDRHRAGLCMYGAVLLVENPMLFLAPQSVLIDSGAAGVTPLKVNILLWMVTLDVLFIIVWYVVSRLAIVVRTNERHLMDAYKQISQAQVEKDRYGVLMTHQLKAPLDAIRSKIGLVKGNYCGEVSPEIKDILGKIDDRAAGMAGLILDVLKLERLKAAARDPNNHECVNIGPVIRKCIDKLAPIANSRQIKVNASIEDFLVQCIPGQLEILFENIIANAITYSYDGGSVEIVSKLDRQSSSALVTVIDHGIGIGDTELPHIFDEYFYAPRAALHNRTSSGIGLSIVKTVAENNKLHIQVASERDVGTAFSVLFQYVGNAWMRKRECSK